LSTKTNFFVFLTLVILIQTISFSSAVPANPTPFEIIQPDGSTFIAIHRGDEKRNWFETEDGYSITQDKNKWWTYAEKAKTGQLISTEKKVTKMTPNEKYMEKHLMPKKKNMGTTKTLSLLSTNTSYSAANLSGAPASAPLYATLNGTEEVVVLPIRFTDTAPDAAHTPAHYNSLLFDSAPGANSMTNYFKEVSYGNTTVTGTTLDWLSSTHTLAYYGTDYNGEIDSGETGTTPIYELAREAVQLADPFINFADYDNDGDGYVDHVIIIHAGAGQESPPTTSTNIWSHKGSIYPPPGELVDGVRVFEYTMLAESSPLGTFAHEFTHDLGAPDLYDYGHDGNPVERWCLMSAGSWNGSPAGSTPSHISGYLKYDLDADPSNGILGWVTPVPVASDQTITVNQTETTATNSLYKIDIANTNQYFLIENRQQTGYDSYLPEAGLIFWHIDKDMPNNNGTPNNPYYRAWVEDPGKTTYKLGAAYSQNDAQTSFTWQTDPNTCSNRCETIISNQPVISFSSIGNESSAMPVTVTFTTPTALSASVNTPSTSFETIKGTPTAISVEITNGYGYKIVDATVTASFDNGDSSVTLYDDGSHGDGSSTDGTYANIWTPANPGSVTVTVLASDSVLADGNANVSGTITAPQNILLVDDDGGNTYETYFESALNAGGYTYDVWDVSTGGSPTAITLFNYAVVIWSTSDKWTDTLTATDQFNLSAYLDGGGSLFLSGQDIGYDLWEQSNGTAFYTDYLHAGYIDDGLGTPDIVGVTGEPLTEGITTGTSEIYGAGNTYPSDISPADGFAAPIFKYDSQAGATGALKIDNGSYQIIYLAFSFETMTDSADKNLLMDNAMQWLDSNTAPTMDGLSVSPDPVKGGGNVILTVSNPADAESDSLDLYCATTSPASVTNSDFCSDTGNASPYPDISCIGTAPADNAIHAIYCRLYDGKDYSTEQTPFFQSDSAAPTTAVVSVAEDTTPPYLDEMDDSVTDVIISGETDMACRSGTTDLAYSGMAPENECEISGTQATCHLGNLAEANYTYHISCQDCLENEQTDTENLDISFEVAFNPIPQLTQLDSNPSLAKGGLDVTITATATDSNLDLLDLYCATTSNAGQSNSDFCSDTGNTSPYPDTSCVGTAVSDDLNHTIYCRIFDGINYSSELTTQYTSDSTAPNLNVSAVPSFSRGEITISADATDSNMDKVNLMRADNPEVIFDSNSTPSGSNYSLDLNTTAIADGNTTFIVQAEDTVGNTSESQFWTVIDNTDPVVENTLGIPAEFISGSENQTFSINLTEANLDQPSVKIWWRTGTTLPFSDVNATCSGTSPNYACSVDLNLTGVPEGTQIQFYGTAKDLADNNTTGTQSTTAIDRTPPTVNTPAVDISCVGENSVVFVPPAFETSAAASDTNSSISSCSYSLNNGTSWNNASYLSGKCTASVSGQSNGANLSIKFKASDLAGNQSTGSDFNATVDSSAPAIAGISVTYPGGDTVAENTESIVVKATITEETCSVFSVTLDAAPIGDSPSIAMNDSGTNGDETAGDNIYSATATVSGVTKTQTINITINALDSLLNHSKADVEISVYKKSSSKGRSSSSGGGGGGGGGTAGSSIEGIHFFEIVKVPDRVKISSLKNSGFSFSLTNIAGVSMSGLSATIKSKTCEDCFSFEITKDLSKKHLPYTPIKVPVNFSVKEGIPAGEYEIEIELFVDTGSKNKKADSRKITIIVPGDKSKRKKPVVEREIYLDKQYLEDRYGFGELYVYPKFEVRLIVKNGPYRVENLKITETIPKEILENVNDLFTELRIDGKSDIAYLSSEYPFTVIDPDPIIEFDLGSAEPFEEKTVSYIIKKERIDTGLFSNQPDIEYDSLEIIKQPTAVCGDGTCTAPDENATVCPQDCATAPKQTQIIPEEPGKKEGTGLCGNQTCDKGESVQNCPQDCGQTQTNLFFGPGFLVVLGIGATLVIFACAMVVIAVILKKSYLASKITNIKKRRGKVTEEIKSMRQKGYRKRRIISTLLAEGRDENEIISGFQSLPKKKGILEKIREFVKKKG